MGKWRQTRRIWEVKIIKYKLKARTKAWDKAIAGILRWKGSGMKQIIEKSGKKNKGLSNYIFFPID